MEEELLNNDLGESATEDIEEEPKQIQAPRKKKTLNENQRKAVMKAVNATMERPERIQVAK